MDLRKLKEYFEALPDDYEIPYCLSKPFSWRGSYDEVAFSLIKNTSDKYDNLIAIKSALTDTFRGYKGGEYQFCDTTEVHFEYDTSSWTDSGYSTNLIEELSEYQTKEEKLIKLIIEKGTKNEY